MNGQAKMLGNRRHQKLMQLVFEWARRHHPEKVLKLRGKARRQVEREMEEARG
jgi:hypothetical protein